MKKALGVSKKARFNARAEYLKLRAIYWKNYLKARYNQFLDNLLGSGNYDAKIFLENKRRQAKKEVREHKQILNAPILRFKKSGYKNPALLKKLAEGSERLTAQDLAVSDAKTRKRFFRMQKFKKRKKKQ